MNFVMKCQTAVRASLFAVKFLAFSEERKAHYEINAPRLPHAPAWTVPLLAPICEAAMRSSTTAPTDSSTPARRARFRQAARTRARCSGCKCPEKHHEG